MCAELADLAMQLARAAAARTLANWAEPEQQSASEPPVTPPAALSLTQPAEPPAPQPAQPRTDRETAPRANNARTTTPKQTDPAVLFTRFAAVARDCIALEARLAAGPTNARNTRTLARRIDRRRILLRDAIYAAAENHPDEDLIRYEAIERLDERLAADPDQTTVPTDILEEICDEFGLEIDWANMPDELLFQDSRKANLNGDAPDPHATSPP